MNIRLSLFSALLCVSVFTGCGDDDNPAGSGGDPTAALTGKNWKMTAFTVDPGFNVGGVTITDFFAQMDACAKDDIQNFKANGTFTVDEGASKCDPADPQTRTGTWVLSTDQKTITTTESGQAPESFTLESVSASQLKVSMTRSDFGDGLNHKATITFTAQ